MRQESIRVISYTQGAELIKKLEQAGLDKELAQQVITSPGNRSARKIVGFLTNDETPFKLPEFPEDEVEAWKVFYQYFFDMEVSPAFPEKHGEFTYPIYIPDGITEDQVIAVSREYYPVVIHRYNTISETGVRNLQKVHGTGIRIRDRQEADEENQGKSADNLQEQGHQSITLIERLILELFHFWKTGSHLDKKSATLCAGSRYAGGGVPCAFWHGSRFLVGWDGSSDADPRLRSRSVYSR